MTCKCKNQVIELDEDGESLACETKECVEEKLREIGEMFKAIESLFKLVSSLYAHEIEKLEFFKEEERKLTEDELNPNRIYEGIVK